MCSSDLIVTGIFVLCSGSLIAKVVRPWKIADDNLQSEKRRWSDIGRHTDSFHDNYRQSSKEDPDGDFVIYDTEEAGFGSLNPEVAQKLCAAGLDLEMLQKVNNEVLLDQLLSSAGVERAGDRLRVILFVRDASPVSSSAADEKTGASHDDFESWLKTGVNRHPSSNVDL